MCDGWKPPSVYRYASSGIFILKGLNGHLKGRLSSGTGQEIPTKFLRDLAKVR